MSEVETNLPRPAATAPAQEDILKSSDVFELTTVIRRRGYAFVENATEPLTGYTRPVPGWQILRDYISSVEKTWRSKLIATEDTIEALAKLPEGEKLSLNVERISEGSQKMEADIIDFIELCTSEDVTKVTLQ